jgi:hypothetical protein
MASTTLNHVQNAGTRGVAGSVLDAAISFKNLLTGLLRASTGTQSSVGVAMSAFEEAEALRNYAQQFVQSDPAFAEDLFASADRHEMASLKV